MSEDEMERLLAELTPPGEHKDGSPTSDSRLKKRKRKKRMKKTRKRKHKRHLSSSSSSESCSSTSPPSSEAEERSGYSTDENRLVSGNSPLSRASNLSIPRRKEFVSAGSAVPNAPEAVIKEPKKRLRIAEPALSLFESAARGTIWSQTEREAYVEALPLIASVYAKPPRVEEEIPRMKGLSGQICESQIFALDGMPMAALGASAIAVQTSAAEAEEDRAKSTGYIKASMSLLEAAHPELVCWRRETILRSNGVDPRQAMPSIRSVPLAEEELISGGDVFPRLYGKQLIDELQKRAGGNDVAKSLAKFKAQRELRSKPQPTPRVESMRAKDGQRTSGSSKPKKVTDSRDYKKKKFEERKSNNKDHFQKKDKKK